MFTRWLALISFSILSFQVLSSEPTTLRIAYPSAGTIISAQVGLVLEKTDILKKHGFASQMNSMSNGRDMKLALLADKVDFIMTSEANFVVLLAEGFPAVGVASLGQGGEMGLTVKSDSGIKSIADLEGKSLGTIYGTSLHRPALDWTKELKKIDVVNLASIGALASALESNKIASAMLWDPHLYDGVSKGRYTVFKREPLDLIVISSKKFMDAHPDANKKFKEALKEAVFYFSQHKDEVNKWYAETSKIDEKQIDAVSKTNRNYNVKKIKDVNVAIDDAFIAKMQKTAQFLFDQKIISKVPEVKDSILK